MNNDFEAVQIADDTFRLTTFFPLPGLGLLPVNAFVIRAAEPVLIDTGLAAQREGFLKALCSVIDPAELRWIWITHMDADHIGNLDAVLQAAPHARMVTTYLGMGKAGLVGLPVERAYLLNPGQRLSVGDRELLAVKPPVFDAPETTGLFDLRSGNLFSSDSFGAVLQQPAESAQQVAGDGLREGMRLWASVDAPWLQVVHQPKFTASLDALRGLQPKRILSSHLPPAEAALLELLFRNMEGVTAAPAFVGPDQAQLELMMAGAQQ
ncbi:MAG: MBL fold metallo-hydrolase [Planctomycetes bacterium]|nr:MBL fold metallo-hydrolase [Planctomycetota bacterium]